MCVQASCFSSEILTTMLSKLAFLSSSCSRGWRAVLTGSCWCTPPDSLEGRNEIDQHFKTLNVLQGHHLLHTGHQGKVGTLIISPAGNEGEEINKQPIIMIRYQRFVLGHTPIKKNFSAVRSSVMNPRDFFMSNSYKEEAASPCAP